VLTEGVAVGVGFGAGLRLAFMAEAGWEIASHGYRWLDYQNVDEDTEREHIRKCVAIQQEVVGSRVSSAF